MWNLFQKKQQIGAGKKVFVGVSGGVDSSVSLALLRDAGYDVTGVFIRTWHPDWLPCDWKDDRRDAMRVCAHLGVPFLELDLEDVYKKDVADYMINEYRIGRTPNPDVMCNRYVKFGAFWDWAKSRGADFIATGHYARISGKGPTLGSEKGQTLKRNSSELKANSLSSQLMPYALCLATGLDPTKDQSYFLWTLRADELAHILFPIGHLPKSKVRKLAEQYGLPTAAKKDSQGICFLGHVDLREFLSRYIETREGDVLDTSGRIIGNHPGALFFTRGERHGFTVTHKTPSDQPYYVLSKDMDANTITVSQDPEHESGSVTSFILTSCVWREFSDTKKYTAHIRYHGIPKPCTVVRNGDTSATISFQEPDYTVSPGQSVVIYDGDICIGGGIVGKAI